MGDGYQIMETLVGERKTVETANYSSKVWQPYNSSTSYDNFIFCPTISSLRNPLFAAQRTSKILVEQQTKGHKTRVWLELNIQQSCFHHVNVPSCFVFISLQMRSMVTVSRRRCAQCLASPSAPRTRRMTGESYINTSPLSCLSTAAAFASWYHCGGWCHCRCTREFRVIVNCAMGHSFENV